MEVSLPGPEDPLRANLTWARVLDTLDVAEAPALADVEGVLCGALDDPIGLDRAGLDVFGPGETVCLIVSDSFRRTAVDLLLPAFLKALAAKGVAESDTSFLVATGTHRGPTDEEMATILGRDIYDRFAPRCFVHDPDQPGELVKVGTSSRGTPVVLNRRAVETDHLVIFGAVVPHYFGGFGGGRKSIVPGIASRETIAHNHAMNLDPHGDGLNPDVAIGKMDGNPVAEDMLEGARMISVDLAVNTVLNRRGDIAGLFVGELDASHRAATVFASKLFMRPISERADLVLAASPDTRNFVQTHKALYNAYQALKPGGRIILFCPCPEGLGGDQFEKWVRLGSREAILAELRRRSEINGQTALSTLQKASQTIMVTSLSYEDVHALGAIKADDLQEALFLAHHDFRKSGRGGLTCYRMPSAAYTVPIVKE